MRAKIETISRYYPLTTIGTPIFLGLLGVLGTAFAVSNPYAYIFSLSGIAVLIVLGIAARLQVRGIGDEDLRWHSGTRVFAGKGPAPHTLEVRAPGVLPLFRIRYTLRGTTRAGGTTLGYHNRSGRFKPAEPGEIPLPRGLPHCGVFHSTLVLSVEDIFGLTRARVEPVMTRSIPVLPGILGRAVRYDVAEQGAEEKTRVKENDIERYYMREYVPGDRFRDINWKSSGRDGKLYTRISPPAQDTTTTVTLCLRFYAQDTHPSPELLSLAEYQKSWAMTFLVKIGGEHPDFQFQVFLNTEEYSIESGDDLQRFAADLGDAWFREPVSLIPSLPVEGRVYLFCTAADRHIDTLRSAYPKTEFALQLTRLPAKEEKQLKLYRPFALFPLYNGEDLPSVSLTAGIVRPAKIASARGGGAAEEAVVLPRFVSPEARE